MRHSIFPNATASRMPLCLSPFVCRLWWGSTWQVKSTRGHSLLLVVCLASCLIILYLIFLPIVWWRPAWSCSRMLFANSSVAQFLLDKNLELIDVNGMAMDIFLDGKEFCNFEDIHDFFWKHTDMIFCAGRRCGRLCLSGQDL